AGDAEHVRADDPEASHGHRDAEDEQQHRQEEGELERRRSPVGPQALAPGVLAAAHGAFSRWAVAVACSGRLTTPGRIPFSRAVTETLILPVSASAGPTATWVPRAIEERPSRRTCARCWALAGVPVSSEAW